jgi:hypothetical protein
MFIGFHSRQKNQVQYLNWLHPFIRRPVTPSLTLKLPTSPLPSSHPPLPSLHPSSSCIPEGCDLGHFVHRLCHLRNRIARTAMDSLDRDIPHVGATVESSEQNSNKQQLLGLGLDQPVPELNIQLSEGWSALNWETKAANASLPYTP